MESIEIQGFNKLEKKALNSAKIIKTYFVSSLKTSVTVIQTAAKRTVNKDTGSLSRSIYKKIDSRKLEGIVGLDYPGYKYGKAVEFGTKPHYVSAKKLAGWSGRKHISSYAVAKSIAKKGTKAHPFMFPAFNKNKLFIKEQFKIALRKIVKNL